MEKFLALQVEHSRYVAIFPLDRSHEKELSLTTLVDNQKQADIRIYLVEGGKKHPVQSFTLKNLPGRKAGVPRIVLKSSFNGRYEVRFRLTLDGRLHESVTLSLRQYLKKGFFRPLLWISLLLLIMAAAFILLGPRICTSPQEKSAKQEYDSDSTESRTPLKTFEAEEAKKPAAARDLPPPPQTTPAEETAREPAAVKNKPEAAVPAEPEPVTAPEKAVFSMEAQVFFGPDNAALTDAARDTLRDIAARLKAHPDAELGVYGHCALYGTERGRIELSGQRAEQVVEFLRDQEWEPEKDPVIRALGGDQPVTRDSEMQHLNRRVELIVPPPDSSSTPRRDR